MNAIDQNAPCQGGNHVRGLNLSTRSYYCKNCGADWDAMKTKKTLYCAVFMVYQVVRKDGTLPILGWRKDMLYMHCDTIEEARLYFYQIEQRVVRYVEIAPVVGYKANDDNADSVSA